MTVTHERQSQEPTDRPRRTNVDAIEAFTRHDTIDDMRLRVLDRLGAMRIDNTAIAAMLIVDQIAREMHSDG